MPTIVCPYEDKYSSVAIWPAGVPFPVPIEGGEARFEYEFSSGMYRALGKLTGLAITHSTGARAAGEAVTVYGVRSLQSMKQEGYAIHGTVKVCGKRHGAFTSSQLFQVEGELVSVAILFVCAERK